MLDGGFRAHVRIPNLTEDGTSIPMEIVSGSFDMEYAQLEETFRRLAERDGTAYLPNPRPRGPVDFIFIAMEPSMGRWKSFEDIGPWLSQGFKNFLLSITDFILHYSIRRFLCGQGETYHVTDISKGPMFIREASQDRWRRWERWYPSLIQEIKVVAKPGAKILALGKEPERFLEAKGFSRLDGRILHCGVKAARYRKRSVEGREAEFERFATAITLDDIVKCAEEATAAAEFSVELRTQILGDLRRRHALSLSQKRLIFTYKVDFAAQREGAI